MNLIDLVIGVFVMYTVLLIAVKLYNMIMEM